MVLEVVELSKEFGDKKKRVTAVDHADIQVKAGEFVSIIGHSGSGKSTLFHLITGMLKPTSGSVIIDHLSIHNNSGKNEAELRNKKIGYILQEQNLLSNFTVLENVCMPSFISHNRYHGNIYEKAEKILEEVGLTHLKNSFPNEISGGEARRVAIARALINDPTLLVADEPTSNLDPENSKTIMQLFRKICDKGVAVLISTHDFKFLEYSEKVYVMEQGKLEEEKTLFE